jgi:hypothetical protein
MPRKVARESAVYRVAQDLWGRLGIAEGVVLPDDYHSDLQELVREKFPSRHAFCEATGLSEEAVKGVLVGREDLSLGALTEALERIGHRLRIMREPVAKAAAKKRSG